MKGRLGNKIRTFVCAGCGKTHTGHARPGTRYCGLACYRSAPKPMRRRGNAVPCAACGRETYVQAHRTGAQHFCSSEHANEWQRRTKVQFDCRVCGKSCTRSPSVERTYCSLACRNADPATRERLLAMNAAQQTANTNGNERRGYRLLAEAGVLYLRQHLIAGKFCVDAFVPHANLVVQFDGDYWHGHPERFPEPDPRQRRRIALDKSQDAYLAKCGFRVLRLWESVLRDQPEHARAALLAALAPPVRRRAARP